MRGPFQLTIIFRSPTGGQLLAGVIVAGELHISNDGQLVREPRLAGHVLADVDAGHSGLYRLEVAADLDWRVRLHVVHVDVAGTADE